MPLNSPVRLIPAVGVTTGAHYRTLSMFFMFQKIKEHLVLLRVACLLLIANVIRHYLVAQEFLSKIDQHPHRHTRRLQIIQQLRCMLCFQHLYRLEFYYNITITH